MAGTLEETLAGVGYAKVIVALKPTLAASSSKAALEQHFMIPSEPQMESLMAVAARSASRRSGHPRPLEEHKMRVYPHLGLALGFVDRSGANALAASNQVEQVVEAPELSLIRPFARRSARLAAAPTWGIKRLKVDKLWAQGIKGRGVIVGHLDTGIDGTHPALEDAIAAFAEFDLAGDQVPGARPTDSGEHGTHTAGTIVGRSVPKGAFGVAPEAKVASAMVIEGGQVIDRILAGMDWVIGEGAQILSMSLGLRGFTPAFQTVVTALRNANVLPVIAVGNEGPNTSRSPGNYDTVLAVGAMDRVRRGRRLLGQPEVQPTGRPAGPRPGRTRGRRPLLRAERQVREDGRHLDGHAACRRRGGASAVGRAGSDRGPTRAGHPRLVRQAEQHARAPGQPGRAGRGRRARDPEVEQAAGRGVIRPDR